MEFKDIITTGLSILSLVGTILVSFVIFIHKKGKADQKLISDVSNVKKDLVMVKDDITVLKDDVSLLKTDVNILKSDVDMLKLDVTVLKSDVNTLKEDVHILRKDVNELKIEVVEIKGEIKEIKSSMGQMSNVINAMAIKIGLSPSDIFFLHKSPNQLTEKGWNLIQESGGIIYVDRYFSELVEELRELPIKSKYDIEGSCYKVLENRSMTDDFIDIKNYLYEKGLNLGLYITTLGIYFRDKVFEETDILYS